MLETIAMWGGVAGSVLALVAIVVMFLTRHSILNILSKDTILYDQNFETKMRSINLAYSVVDEIVQYGDAIKSSPDFVEKAKRAYNELLCVLSDVRIADEFQTIALENKHPYNIARIAQFKLMCRKDLGLKTGKSHAVKRALELKEATQMTQPQFVPAQPAQVQQPATAPVQPTQPMPQRPVAAQPRPAQAVRPAARPTAQRPSVPPTGSSAPRGNGRV